MALSALGKTWLQLRGDGRRLCQHLSILAQETGGNRLCACCCRSKYTRNECLPRLQSIMHVLQLNHDATQVAALLDFGDMCHTYAAAELAITLAYAMLLEVSLQQRQGGTQQQAAGGDAEGERLVHAAYAAGRAVVVSATARQCC